MKKQSLGQAAVVLFLTCLFFLSCKKINEATELGGDLIPAIDNVNTFELSLATQTDNFLMADTTLLLTGDRIAIGHITNDPEFGQTHANGYFTIGASTYGTYPFLDRATLSVDSVVLSLAYTGAYGDTNSSQTIRVFEVAPGANLEDDILYKYTDNDLPTVGAELGFKSFVPSSLKDSTLVIRKDTQKVANVVRIRLNISLGLRFADYDITETANGGFKNDSIFRTLFEGLAIKADASGNTLSYFDVFDNAKTRLTVYYTATKDSKKDTLAVNFVHNNIPYSNINHPAGVLNTVKRTSGGNWASYLTNGNPQDDKLYIQSSPGSYGLIKIPALTALDNKLIHLAELIIYRLPSTLDNIYTPSVLYLDRINNTQDSAFTFEKDQPLINTGEVSYNGGTLGKDNTYRFNLTRHVQGIVTRKEQNHALRVYAPLRTTMRVKVADSTQRISVPVLSRIAEGRVVLGGGNYSDPNLRMRLRLVYSNL